MDQHYRKTFDQITMPEDKAQAIRSRLAARCSQDKPDQEVTPMKKAKGFPRTRILAVAVAAVLLLSLGTAGAIGIWKPASEFFAGLLGSSPAQTEIIDQIGYPVDACSTADGYTITVDAVIGDAWNCIIFYSVIPEEGQPLPMRREEGDHVLTFWLGGEDGPPLSLYDADSSSLRFVEISSGSIQQGMVTRTFSELSFGKMNEGELLAEGPWTLKFNLSFEDTSLTLATNQAISVKGETTTVDSIAISPLSVTIESSFDKVIGWQDDMNSDPFASYEEAPLGRAIFALPISITLKDGSVLDLSDNESSSIGDRGRKTYYTRNCLFPEILPLDTIESVTIGELTIPVEQ